MEGAEAPNHLGEGRTQASLRVARVGAGKAQPRGAAPTGYGCARPVAAVGARVDRHAGLPLRSVGVRDGRRSGVGHGRDESSPYEDSRDEQAFAACPDNGRAQPSPVIGRGGRRV